MSALSPSGARVLHFGVFELDRQAQELWKHGVRVKLQEQPFQILAILLERPGEVVTREEIRQRLWRADTFVDFEHSINTAVKRLREALDDSADNPRFVETLARRGYRFIAPVGAEGSIQERLQRKVWPTALAALGIIVLVGLLLPWLTAPLAPPRVLRYKQVTNDLRPKAVLTWCCSLVTDGSRLYFTELQPGGSTIYQVSIAGGDPMPVPAPFKIGLITDISRTGSELLVSDYDNTEGGGPLWVVPLVGGPARRLGDVHSLSATWSPDGEDIVYAQGRELYGVRRDGTKSRRLVTTPGIPLRLRWSPDGSVLRFTLSDPKSGSNSLWEVAADGTKLHPLLPDWNSPSDTCCGNWTPDGNYFVFQSSRGGTTDIWAIREKKALLRRTNRKPVQLTAGPTNSFSPVLSRDGEKIFVVGAQRRGELVRYDPKGHRFVRYLSGISAQYVNVSRDRKWVVYVSFPEGSLWRSKADGSEQLQLTFPPMQVDYPRWSPDGKQIALTVRAPGKPAKICLLPANGGSLQELLPEERAETDAGWSPDGGSIVFGRGPWVDPAGSSTMSVHLIDLKTRRVSKLPGSEGLYGPQWSPDGRYIAALSHDSLKLMFYDFTTRKWTQLYNGFVGCPNWSRDSRYIYFDNLFLGKEPAFLRVRMGDRKVEQVLSLNDFGRIASDWTGLAPDDSPMLLRDVSIEEIYALDWQAP
jgi:Tol biopolymer transport system component/DNA-binding winged helix-turn-helix (wHTH) protein